MNKRKETLIWRPFPQSGGGGVDLAGGFKAGRYEQEIREGMPAEFHETVNMMAKGGVEMMAEIDFFTGLVQMVSQDGFGRTVLSAYSMAFYDNTLMPVKVTDVDGEVGKVGFLIERRMEEGLVRLGVGTLEKAMWVAQAMLVDLGLLSGEIDVVCVDAFLKGIPPKGGKNDKK